MKTLTIILTSLIISSTAYAMTSPSHGIMDGVNNIDDIPYGECRFVANIPQSLSHMNLGASHRYCNTLGVVPLTPVEVPHG